MASGSAFRLASRSERLSFRSTEALIALSQHQDTWAHSRTDCFRLLEVGAWHLTQSRWGTRTAFLRPTAALTPRTDWPAQSNRENFRQNRELIRGNREFCLASANRCMACRRRSNGGAIHCRSVPPMRLERSSPDRVFAPYSPTPRHPTAS